MTLQIHEPVHNKFLYARARAAAEERSEFGLGVLLDGERGDILIDFIPETMLVDKHCKVESETDYHSLPEYAGLQEGHAGAAIWNFQLPPRLVLSGLQKHFRLDLSPSHSLKVSKDLFQGMKEYNETGFIGHLGKYWNDPTFTQALHIYQKMGKGSLVPCFIRPDKPFSEGNREGEDYITQDLPSLDEIALQNMIGAPQTIIATGYLGQSCGQDYLHARKRPKGLFRDQLDLPGRLFKIGFDAIGTLSQAILDLEKRARSEVDFYYQVVQ